MPRYREVIERYTPADRPSHSPAVRISLRLLRLTAAVAISRPHSNPMAQLSASSLPSGSFTLRCHQLLHVTALHLTPPCSWKEVSLQYKVECRSAEGFWHGQLPNGWAIPGPPSTGQRFPRLPLFCMQGDRSRSMYEDVPADRPGIIRVSLYLVGSPSVVRRQGKVQPKISLMSA